MMKGFSKLIEAIAFRVHSIRHCLRLSPQFFPCPMNAPTWCLWALHFGSNFFTQAADTSWFEAVSTTTHIIPSCFCEQVHVSPACCWLLFYNSIFFTFKYNRYIFRWYKFVFPHTVADHDHHRPIKSSKKKEEEDARGGSKIALCIYIGLWQEQDSGAVC